MKVKNTDKMKKMYVHNKVWENMGEGDDGIIEVKISELIPFGRYTGCVTVDESDKITQTKEEKLWRKRKIRGIKTGLKRLFKAPESILYPWEALKNSIQKDGYDPEKYGYISVRTRNGSEGKRYFQVVNGNHRIEVLSALYGPDYTLKVKKTNTASVTGILKIIPQGLMNVPMIHFPGFIFFFWYLLLPVLITAIGVWVILACIKDIRDLSKTDKHPKKNLKFIHSKLPQLYNLMMNIYYNLTYILSGIVIGLFTIYSFSHYWLEFLIMIGITFIFGFVLRLVGGKFNIEKNPSYLSVNDIIENTNK